MVVVEGCKVEVDSKVKVGNKAMVEVDNMDFAEGSKVVLGIAEKIENFEEVWLGVDSLVLHRPRHVLHK